jgi:hypothetical protein
LTTSRNRKKCRGIFGHRSDRLCGIDIIRLSIYIDENRIGTDPDHSVRRGGMCEIWHDHLVIIANAHGFNCHFHTGSTRGSGDRVFDINELGEGFLELLGKGS